MSRVFFVTGSAGFIGFHLAQRLLEQGHSVVGLDSLNDYYSVDLKRSRNEILKKNPRYEFHHSDLSDRGLLTWVLNSKKIDTVYHLAAQAGVRYSVEHPEVYLRSNVDGTFYLLEAARHASHKPQLVLASSSSVYGLSHRIPFREDDAADRPVSLYGATKRSNELMAHSYSHLFGLKTTMVRFFTVYGPWGRPDMALYKFVKSVFEGKEIEVYNHGKLVRDFTYVDDIVDGILGLADARASMNQPLYDVLNIGCSRPRTVMEFIHAIESATGRKAELKMLEHQQGDVVQTHADISKIRELCGYEPKMQMEDGVARFVKWYREYHSIK